MVLLIFAACLLALSEVNTVATPKNGRHNFTQLTDKYGRLSEDFDVVTEDGYILTLFHIKGNEGNTPVLLMHGLLDSADTFVLRGKSSIAMALAEEGYDVWVGNSRGNIYSRRHLTLSPDIDIQKFWDFSFHEMGVYDLPATIDFILEKTGKQKLSAIGHSQGTTMFYVLGSERPKYNDKLSVIISLAPIAYLNNLSPEILIVKKIWQGLSGFLKMMGYEEEFQDRGAAGEMIHVLCSVQLMQIGYVVCERGIMEHLCGADSEELEPEFFRVVTEHIPTGTSWKNANHFAQVVDSGRFIHYNYGLIDVANSPSGSVGFGKTLLRETPPAYNLRNVTMPVALIIGGKDKVSLLSNVELLKGELPNVIDYYVIERFNHLDFVWARHLEEYLMPMVKDLLLKYA